MQKERSMVANPLWKINPNPPSEYYSKPFPIAIPAAPIPQRIVSKKPAGLKIEVQHLEELKCCDGKII
jgi:hypothetical protein